ncbi:MAG: hypothetical protein Q9216_005501 [Gyalolechia sp. 2 TL-2023]
MSLHITTNCTNNVPGSTVTGTVFLHVIQPLNINNLAVTLSGRAQTNIDQSTQKAAGCVFHTQRLFFATKKSLLKESVQGQRLRPWDRFESDAEEQLPPDFASSYTKADGSHAAKAAVIYELKASLVARENRLEAIEPLNFLTTRSVEHPELVTTAAHAEVALRSARLSRHGAQKSLLGSRRLRYAVSSKSPPLAAFQLYLQGSRQGVIGQPFPLQLGVQFDKSLPTSADRPKVHLQCLDVKLRARTSIRCSGTRCFKTGCLSIHKGDEFEDWDDELQLGSCDLTKLEGCSRRSTITFSKAPGLVIPHHAAGEDLDLQEHTVIPSYFVPSFKSFIINRNYTLVVNITVSCAGKNSNYTFVTRSFLLHARDFAERKENSMHSSDTNERFGAEDSADTAPKLFQYA